MAVVANVAAALVGLAAGLMASARNSEWMRAAVWAEFYVLALTLMVAPVIYLFFAGGEWVRSLGLIGTASLTLWTAVLRVSRRLKHRWQQEMVEPPRPRWTRNFHESDFWQGVFRWNKGRTLDRNPVAAAHHNFERRKRTAVVDAFGGQFFLQYLTRFSTVICASGSTADGGQHFRL